VRRPCNHLQWLCDRLLAVLMTTATLMLVVIAMDVGATSKTFAAMLGAVVSSMIVLVLTEYLANRESEQDTDTE
jgi:purine-cytosine permease-like protein